MLLKHSWHFTLFYVINYFNHLNSADVSHAYRIIKRIYVSIALLKQNTVTWPEINLHTETIPIIPQLTKLWQMFRFVYSQYIGLLMAPECPLHPLCILVYRNSSFSTIPIKTLQKHPVAAKRPTVTTLVTMFVVGSTVSEQLRYQYWKSYDNKHKMLTGVLLGLCWHWHWQCPTSPCFINKQADTITIPGKLITGRTAISSGGFKGEVWGGRSYHIDVRIFSLQ